jgi:hypothetical protein
MVHVRVPMDSVVRDVTLQNAQVTPHVMVVVYVTELMELVHVIKDLPGQHVN